MPKRTNLLQQVVGILHEHAAPGAEVTEPAMLPHQITGEDREVDVVIAIEAAGYKVVVSVEARARGRKADSPWVESMLGKHLDLPTSKLVLVSESGFYKPARDLALAKGALPLAPEDLDPGDPALAILRGLPALWPKQVALTPQTAALEVLTPDGGLIRIADADPAEMLIFSEAGAAIGTVTDYFGTVFDQRFPELAAMIGLADIDEDIDRFFTFGLALPPAPTPDLPAMFLRREPDGQLQRLVEIRLTGTAEVRVGEIPLHRRRLGDISYAYGEGDVDAQRLLLVVSESEAGSGASLQLADGSKVPLRPVELIAAGD
jgi:hypothetical protein